MDNLPDLSLRDHLRTLRGVLPALVRETLSESPSGVWLETLEHNVLPALDFDLPVLLVAICGGGSTGKSTLVNALAGRRVSHVAFRAGLTQRVLLVGHPSILAGPEVAARLLHRLRERPVPWTRAEETTEAGPPLYATSTEISPNLLLIDTPDFDTGEGGRMLNRERAEPVLRTAEVLVYIFTNAVYSNLSNTTFMAEVVGGVGGRPTVLVYRVSRVASDAEVLEHCRVVARRLYGGGAGEGFPPEVIGVYRVHESDRVAEGRAVPELLPVGEMTAGRSLQALLRDLDVTRIKRHVFANDLRVIRRDAGQDYQAARRAAVEAALYREGVRQAMAEESVQALRSFPANEALALTARLFIETSPPLVRALRRTGVIVGAPLRGLRALGRKVAEWAGSPPERAEPEDAQARVSQDLLLAANTLRNRLLEDPLIVQVTEGAPLLERVREQLRQPDAPPGLAIEAGRRAIYNLTLPMPAAARRSLQEVLAEDWGQVAEELDRAAVGLVGLPAGIGRELREAVLRFRQDMGWRQRVRETLFASLSALPPLLGVTYTLLTADPVTGASLLIRLQSVLGLNDLLALISIPASAGLSEQDRRQLEAMLKPVFQLWLEQRARSVVDLFEQTVGRATLEAVEAVPLPEDARFGQVAQALDGLTGAP